MAGGGGHCGFSDGTIGHGIAHPYQQHPFSAKVGEKVRFRVLAVGPNLSTSFHILGGQFDTVHFKDGYQLMDGRGTFGNTGGGSQALRLETAQDGFVKFVFPKAGRCTVVDHAFRGAAL